MYGNFNEAMSKTYCAYCGQEFAIDDEAASKVTEHIYSCPKHPMREAEALAQRRGEVIQQIYQVLYSSADIESIYLEVFQVVEQALADEPSEAKP